MTLVLEALAIGCLYDPGRRNVPASQRTFIDLIREIEPLADDEIAKVIRRTQTMAHSEFAFLDRIASTPPARFR